uniref:hypothetical protein n=1 Tax=Eisenbergiella tayi TaxID=1432052 RepID=UPI003FEEFC8B
RGSSSCLHFPPQATRVTIHLRKRLSKSLKTAYDLDYIEKLRVFQEGKRKNNHKKTGAQYTVSVPML